MAENFLFKRELLPHQWYLLNGAMACSTSFPVYSILSEQMPTFDRESIAKWGALLEMDVVPTFTSAYIWCKPETSIHKKSTQENSVCDKTRTGELSYVLSHPARFDGKEVRAQGEAQHIGACHSPVSDSRFSFLAARHVSTGMPCFYLT